MKTVFLSGSRNTNQLDELVRSRIKEWLHQRTNFIVGDANGADKVMQGYLADENYRNVIVFCSGSVCRNNVGDWDVQEVSVDPNLKGRAFYTQKDKEMASIADSGFVLWDGKSIGSINNAHELLKNGKNIVVYLSPKQKFIDVTNRRGLEELILMTNQSDARTIFEKLKIKPSVDEPSMPVQGELNLYSGERL